MTGRTSRWRWVFLLPLAALTGCSFMQADHFSARQVSFADLPGWQDDDHAQALESFLASCFILARAAKPASTGSGLQVAAPVWVSLCNDASLASRDRFRAQQFFETHFTPFRVMNNGKEQGLFTGYYEPMLYGSHKKGGDFQYPVYAAPPGMGDKGPTHAEINRGALAGKKLEILYVDDPVMLFFMQIQGSGRIKLTDGRTVRVGFAGKNGQSYVGLGKIMGDEKLIPKDNINFFTIRQWLYTHKEEAFEMMEKNPSYVFFKESNGPGPIGAVGAVLTPTRSLAVDSRYIPYGLPLYLETELPPEEIGRAPTPMKRVLIAQDTGGAIKGPVRGDIFFGSGDWAEYFAGYMKGRGVYTLLVPNDVAYQLK